jgi:copper chaperone NosL
MILIKKNLALFLLIMVLIVTSCSSTGPEPIYLNKDDCDNCKMSISDKRFACELVTEKGRIYKFDDISCMVSYANDHNDKMTNAQFYIIDYLLPNELMPSDKLSFVEGEKVASPMGGNIAAFSNKDSASVYTSIWDANPSSWQKIYK